MGVLGDLGKEVVAGARVAEIVQHISEVQGERHPDTLTAMGNLARTLYQLDKLAEAEAMQREVLAAEL